MAYITFGRFGKEKEDREKKIFNENLNILFRSMKYGEDYVINVPDVDELEIIKLLKRLLKINEKSWFFQDVYQARMNRF